MTIQGTEEWALSKVGKFGASKMADLLAGGKGLTRDKYLLEIAIERMTGIPTKRYQSPDILWGIETEPEARAVYEISMGVDIAQVGFITHPRFPFAGASPDGLVGDDGGLEIKCRTTFVHIETIKTGKIPRDAILQVQWGMACTEREWWDYFCYDPRIPILGLQKWRRRIYRDEKQIAEMESEVVRANEDVEVLIEELKGKLNEQTA